MEGSRHGTTVAQDLQCEQSPRQRLHGTMPEGTRMKKWWQRFRSWDEKGPFMQRVKGELVFTKGGYCFDRRIFRVVVIIMFLGIFGIMITSNDGHENFYLHCPQNNSMGQSSPCNNPYYLSCDREECQGISQEQTLPPGFTIGNPPSEILSRQIRGLVISTVGLFILAFVANHYWYNKGRSIINIEE